MRGIVLAGGTGSRLWPATISASKQLLPIFDKPLIYYPLSTLMQLGITNILVICRGEESHLFQKVLGDGSRFGINLSYKTQNEPKGIAEALLIGENFLEGESCTLILGDNIFYGSEVINNATVEKNFVGSKIFSYEVINPQEFGVVEFNEGGKPIRVIEKPNVFVSSKAVTGLYIFDRTAPTKAKNLVPSRRGEIEISDLINMYASENNLQIANFGKGTAWLDTGNAVSMHDASTYVRIIEERTGTKIACLEEIGLNMGYLSKQKLIQIVENYPNSKYREYILNQVL